MCMARITIHAAKTNLSKLIERARSGEEIVICRGKEPVARLAQIGAPPKRAFGAYRGQFTVPDTFFDPLPEGELHAWEGFSDDGQPPLGHTQSAVVDGRKPKSSPAGARGNRKR
jgi:antitoxin (DNA-binding transcriptional repressor) of toxin-antitoxin stability system